MMLQESARHLMQQSEFTVIVFGKGEDFVLLQANGNDEDSELSEAEDAGRRGMKFCGVLALTNEGPKADIAPDNLSAVHTMMFAEAAFVRVVDRLKPKDDSVEWLTRLFVLPDTRT
jgi:hypothetical protein